MPIALPSLRSRAHVPPPAKGTTLTTLAVVCVCIFALWVAREVFIPIVLSILLAFVLAPIVRMFRRWRIPNAAAILLAVGLAVGVIATLGTVIGIQLVQLGQQAPKFKENANAKVQQLKGGPIGRLATQVQEAKAALREASRIGTDQSGKAPEPATKGAATPEKTMLVKLPEKEDDWFALAPAILGPVLSPLSTLFIVLVVVIFMLLEREDLRDRVIRLFGSGDFKATTDAIDDAARRLSVYFLAQVGVNAAFGVIVGGGLAFIGVPSPVLWGVLAMLLRFVPYIGSLLSAALPILLAAAARPGWSAAIETAALFVVVEGITGQVIEPLLYGRSTGLSAFAVIVAAMFWAWLWGPIGLILSTPFTVAVVVLGHHVRQLQFLDVMFGDKPALTPTENFYQRMLAGDVDEARDHAEHMLGTCSLCAYHDAVTVSAMRLAIKDIERGALTGDAIQRMKGSLLELMGDLALSEKAKADSDLLAGDPAPPRSSESRPTVLCVAGRGALDEEASAVLVQLLHKHGVSARFAPHDAVSRQSMSELDTQNVAVVCLVHVEVGDRSPYLRYLMERIRQRLPGTKVILGLWPSELDGPDDVSQLGADRIARSLREILQACLEQLRRPATKVVAA